MTEQWTRWEPVPGLAKKYYIDEIVDAVGSFSIFLSDLANKKNQVRVTFERSVDAYKRTDESFRLKIMDNLNKKYGENFYVDWTFFKVTNSSYLRWLSEESYEISDLYSFTHFSFVASESILDVVTCYEPKVELVEEP